MGAPFPAKANVLDVRDFLPAPNDRLLVDSNVWFFVGRSNTNEHDRKAEIYRSFVERCLKGSAKLFWSSLTIPEIWNAAEKMSKDIAAESGLIGKEASAKDFRYSEFHDPAQIAAEVEEILEFMSNSAQHAPDFPIVEALAGRIISETKSAKTAGYDSIFSLMFRDGGYTAFVTDDRDFASVPGLTMATANRLALPPKGTAKSVSLPQERGQ